MKLAINIVGFQVGWFAAVLGGAHAMALAGTIAALVVVAVHLLLAPKPGKEASLVLIATVIGLVWESALVDLGLTIYPSGVLVDGTAPTWIVAMWALFATTVNVSLRWLRGRFWLAILVGAVSGPLAFYAGHKLGGVMFPDPVLAMIVLAVGWGIFVPVLVWLGSLFDGTRENEIDREVNYV